MEPLFEKHYVSRYFLVSMTDVELPCRNTVSKSLNYFFIIIILQAVVPKKKQELTIAFITPSWVAIACSQTLYFHFKVRLGREPP